MSLRTKLALTHTLIALLAIVVIALAINRGVNTSVRQLAADRARDEARRVALSLGQLYEQQPNWDMLLRLVENNPNRLTRFIGQRVLLADQRGVIVFDSLNRLTGQVLPAAVAERSEPIVANGTTVGQLSVAPIANALGELEDRFLVAINRLLFLVSMVAGLGAAVVGTLLATGLTRPLAALTNATKQVTRQQNQTHVALPVRSYDEVGQLTTAFNQMSAELASQEEKRRQLVADIAHELRTPISVLRMELEALEDGINQPTAERLASLQEEVGLLHRLVDDLRLLSLTDAGQLSLQLSNTDLVDIGARVMANAEQRARQRQIQLVNQLPDHLPMIMADPQRLAQALGNLVENGLRYTPAGGEVRLLCQQVGADRLRIIVADSGPGIPADECERIFDRFYRTDRARSRESGGTGLGLAIVRGLIHAMNGRVWAESVVGQGARFMIELPTASALAAPSPIPALR